MEIVADGSTLTTKGLILHRQCEIRMKLCGDVFARDGEALLRYVADRVVRSGATIRSLDTMHYGYWPITFVSGRNGCLDVWEYNAMCTKFVEGARLALTYWRDQHDVCHRANAPFDPPRPEQFVMVSDGVFDGGAVKGVRSPAPQHMSGWSIVSARCDGVGRSVRQQHLYQLTSRRPDLAQYMALPVGFHIDLSGEESIWLQKDVVQE